MFARHGSLLPCSQKFAFLFKFGNTCLFLFQISVHLYFKYLFIYISNICSIIFQISVHLYFKYLFIYISNICSFIFHISVHLYFNYLHIHLYQFIDLSTLYISTMLQATRLRETVRNCLLEGAETGDVWQEVSEKDMWVKRCSL